MESAIYQKWLDAGYFTADPASTKPAYSIVLPPPNVTGSLHMGHALEHTMMDALTAASGCRVTRCCGSRARTTRVSRLRA